MISKIFGSNNKGVKMIKETKVFEYVCDECKEIINSNQFGDLEIDLGSSNDTSYKVNINIITNMSYRVEYKDICYNCKLKILKRAVNKLEELIKEK